MFSLKDERDDCYGCDKRYKKGVVYRHSLERGPHSLAYKTSAFFKLSKPQKAKIFDPILPKYKFCIKLLFGISNELLIFIA